MTQSDINQEFSVIIPVYNVSQYLKACVDSVLAQTYGYYELILVDDGSNDGSEAICDCYASEYGNVTVIHKENGGQSSARNLGVELARGQYFIFVDSDDYIAANTLEMFADKIARHGELDIILSEYMYNVESDGTVIDNLPHQKSGDFEGIDGQQVILKMGMEWSPCGKCFRTEFWRGKGFSFIEGIISEDFQLIDKVTLEAQKVSMVSAHYYYRWKNESSTMHANYEKLVKDTIFVIEDWMQYLAECSYDKQLNTIIYSRLANMLEHTVMGNVFYSDKDMIDTLLDGAKRCCCVLKYDKSFEGFTIRLFVGTIGVRKTCFLLNKLKTYRKRKELFV